MTIAARDWVVIYPTTHKNDTAKTRSIILIRSNLITEDWEQLEFESGDVTAIKLKGEWGQLVIVNVYNDCVHNETIKELARYHSGHRESIFGKGEDMEKYHAIWLGDFNRHHPCWDATKNNVLFTNEALEQAEYLIHTLVDLGMDLVLPSGKPTHEHNVTKRWSRLDQVFATEHTLEIITACKTLPDQQGPNTDHFPILMEVDLITKRAPLQTIRNFKDVDWERFQEKLANKIQKWGVSSIIKTQSELDLECTRLTEALQKTIEEVVLQIRLGPQCRRWWTKELAGMRKSMLKARRAAYADKRNTDLQALSQFKEARRKFSNKIEHAKRNHWRDWLEQASDPDLWTAQKYLNAPASDGGKTRIPDLKYTANGQQCTASDNQSKSKVLAKTFFPSKPEAMQLQAHEVNQAPVEKMSPITEEQIRRQLARLKPYKAPGPDRIPNIVLTKCADLISNRLGYIFMEILNRKFYFMNWKRSNTVVLRKPRKPRYDVPKAYRPIALLNTMGKVLTALVAESLTYYVEKHNLLPPTHFRGRPARTTSDTIHYLVYKIKDAWRKRQVTLVLFLDIEGAFPNAVNEQLICNLIKRKVPTKIVEFVKNMLQGRSTYLKFDDFTLKNICMENGIGQGDPLSMVLYQFYNADILDMPNTKNEAAAAYVDDTILIATAKTFEEMHQILMDMMTREGGAMDWAKAHNSNFEITKLALIDFAHQSKAVKRKSLQLQGVEIEPAGSTKHLGVMIDQSLTWKEQEAYAIKKGAAWMAQSGGQLGRNGGSRRNMQRECTQA